MHIAMVKPKFYKQYDRRWATSLRGCTMAGYGCGENAVANVVAALVNPRVTPVTIWNYITSHGYMIYGAGTAWAGITAALNKYGIKSQTTCDFEYVKKCLRKGWWVIGVVRRSRWTRGGHFILLYGMDSNGYIHVSDSASNAQYRAYAPFSEYRAACSNNWVVIDPNQYIKQRKKTILPAVRDTVKKAVFYVGDDYANIRISRSTNNTPVGTLKKNTKVVVGEYSNGWWKLKNTKYKGKFIHESTLGKYKHITRYYRVNVAMNVRDGYSTKGTKVQCVVSAGVILKTEKQRAGWVYCKAQKGLAHSGWIKAQKTDGSRYLDKVSKKNWESYQSK